MQTQDGERNRYRRSNSMAAHVILSTPGVYAPGSLPHRWARLWRERHGQRAEHEDDAQRDLFDGDGERSEIERMACKLLRP